MPIDVASILLSALAQIAGEYGVAVPLAGVARRILDDKARRAAFTEAVQAAYADLKASVHGDVAQALLDPHYLSRPAVAQELLGAVLIAGAVDYDHLQQLYVRSTGFDHIHVRPALRYLVERTRKHAADRHPWFQQWYGLELDQQQLQTQQQIAAILERIEEALTEREEAPAPEPEPEPQPALRVLVLLSAPLVDGKGNPVARLDLAQERALIETVLRESGADIQVRFRHATAEALRDGVRDGYDVVHFSGHGDLSVLAFEDEHGQLHTIDRGLLARLVRVGDQAARLVVLNACHSESLAEDLTAAGVAHVVAVERDEPVIDEAAIAFARDFYHALARGFTLEAAFEEGRDAVASAADLGVRAVAEEVKFRLLPGDRDHDAPLAEEGEGRGGYVEEGRLTAPINLPTPLDIFVGREREMWEINRQLSQGRLVTLTGTGGVGKTELARETARWHQARGRFPDGVFVVELEEARGPAAILTQIATTLRLERAESAEDVAKTLGRRQMLLVLDNLDDALHANLRGARELLETLVTRTEAPRFLVTSRQPVGRPRWENVYHVERLRIPADWKLFTDLSVNVGYRWHPGDEAALDEVLHFLDGLPLAIVLTAAQLSETNLAQLWDELERARTAALNEPGLTPEERGRLTSVDFSLTLSYNRLSAEAQRLFAAFSVFAGGADEGALDAVWGDAGWHEPIRALRRFSLVDEYHGRYSMLNPVREFAAGRLAELPDAPYHARMARHYQKIAAMCDADIGGVHSLTAVNLMALELVNIHAGMDWAVAAAEAGQILDDRPAWEFLPSRLQRWLQALDGRALDGGKSALELVRDYAEVLTAFYHLYGIWEEGEQRLRKGIEVCQKAGDKAGVAFLAHNTGVLVQYRGDYAEARRLYQQSFEIKEQLGDQAGIASSLYQLGRIAQLQGDYDGARWLYQQSLEIFEKLKARTNIARSLHTLGMIAQEQGDYGEARRLYQQSLEIKEKLGDQAGIATSLHQLGLLAQYQGNYNEARHIHKQSLAILKKLGNQVGVSASLHELGVIAKICGNYEEACHFFQWSLEIEEELGHQRGIAISCHELGVIAELLGDYDEARRFYQKSLEINEKLGDQVGVANSLGRLGILAHEQGDYERARYLYQQSLIIFKKLRNQLGIASNLHLLGMIAQVEGDYAEARQLYQQSLGIFERLKSPDAETARRNLERLEEDTRASN